MERVIAYIDGFNLYFGLKSKDWRRYYWLDLPQLVRNLLRPHQQLVTVKYFTARISGPSQDTRKQQRQGTYLEALATLPDLKIFFGHYLPKQQKCFNCQATWYSHEEKMTDVNIAVELLTDAIDDHFDTALLMSADSDLSAPLRVIRQRTPKKRIVVAFPPGRHSEHLKALAHASFTIGRKKLHDSQLPERVAKSDGFVLSRPGSWKG